MESGVKVVGADIDHFRELLRGGRTIPAPAPTAGHAVVRAMETPIRPKPKPATVGRFQTMNEFVDYSAKSVGTTAQAVWLVLFRETKPNGLATISFNQVAELIGLKRRAAMRGVQDLEEAKLLTVVKRGRLNAGASTYRVHGTPQPTLA